MHSGALRGAAHPGPVSEDAYVLDGGMEMDCSLLELTPCETEAVSFLELTATGLSSLLGRPPGLSSSHCKL